MNGPVAKNGERFLATFTPNSPRYALESQIRDCYGRAAYSHKTHEKMAERHHKRLGQSKWVLILLSAVTTGGTLGALIDRSNPGFAVGAALLSLISLIANSYMKNMDPGALSQRHRDAASKLWTIRERYLSLLTDIHDEANSLDDLRKSRDQILSDLGKIHAASPQTDGTAYGEAQDALQNKEDLTFSEEELNALLPTSLKRKDR